MKKRTGILALALLVVLAGCVRSPVETIGSEVAQGVAGRVALENIVPDRDVVGEDLQDVPRPEGFVRVEYYSESGSTEVKYRKAGDDFDRTYQFYRKEMQERGWELESEGSSSGVSVSYNGMSAGIERSVSLTYTRNGGNEEVTVDILLGEIMDTKFTEVGISYYSYSVVESEEEQLEPINEEPYSPEFQYPGSVLYDRSRSNLMGSWYYTDRYFVDADAEDVYNYYLDLSVEGMEPYFSEFDGDSGTVTFITPEASEGVTVTLDRDGSMTTIEVLRTVHTS